MDALDVLLEVASKHLPEEETQVDKADLHKKKVLQDADIFKCESNLPLSTVQHKCDTVIHSGDTDSSDDEGNRNYEDQKYNTCGKEIKRLLQTSETNSISSSHYGIPKVRVSSWQVPTSSTVKPKAISKESSTKEVGNFQDVYLDPIFKMKIVNPKISSTVLSEKMQGRLAVYFSELARLIMSGNLKNKDWVICGVVANKSPPKTSQKGTQYSIWTITDLKDDIKTVALFMFNTAHSDLWKTLIGTVIGVLNPNIMERKDGSKDVVRFYSALVCF